MQSSWIKPENTQIGYNQVILCIQHVLLHKKYIGCFYFTLGNLSPKYRSTLKSIQLLALIKNVHIKKYGIESVLECITCDIKKLEKVNDSKVYKSNID